MVPSAFDTCADGHQPRARIQQLLEFVQQQLALVVDGRHAQHRAFLFGQKLPRHNVRMVLQRRDDNFSAPLHVPAAPGLRDQVDAFGSAANEDDLARVLRVDEALHFGPAVLIALGRALAQLVYAAMDVRVVGGIQVADSVDHLQGLLRAGGVIEIHQRIAVDPLAQDGEVAPDVLDVEGDSGGGHAASTPSRCDRIRSMSAFSESSLTRSTMSLAKAWISISRALASAMPRLRK